MIIILLLELFSENVNHFCRIDDVFIFAHNNGTDENIYFKESLIQITDNKLCKRIQTGGGCIAKDVGQFNQRSLQYFEDHEGCRFPPSYYLKEDSTCQWANKIEGFLKHKCSYNVKIIVGYNPIIHLQLLGLEMNEYEQVIGNTAATNYENLVIVINNKRRWVMVSVVTDETDQTSIGMELNKLDGILKTIYHANLNRIKSEFIAIVGILVCPNIQSRSQLKSYQPIRLDQDVDQLFITKDEWNSEQKSLNWWTKKINLEFQTNCPGIKSISDKYFSITQKLYCTVVLRFYLNTNHDRNKIIFFFTKNLNCHISKNNIILFVQDFQT